MILGRLDRFLWCQVVILQNSWNLKIDRFFSKFSHLTKIWKCGFSCLKIHPKTLGKLLKTCTMYRGKSEDPITYLQNDFRVSRSLPIKSSRHPSKFMKFHKFSKEHYFSWWDASWWLAAGHAKDSLEKIGYMTRTN